MAREAYLAIGLEVLVLVGSRSARQTETRAFRAVGSEWTDARFLLTVTVREAVVSELAFHALSLSREGLVES